MRRRTAGLEAASRGSLQGVVARRLDVERRADPSDPAPAVHAHHTAFATLPGMQQLKLQRAAAELVGIANPFFRAHEARAGATTRIDGKHYVNFSSYDYLGLNGHREVQAAATAAIATFGTSCSASRLVAGERPLHRQLEGALAAHYSQDDAVVFVSGHGTNVAVIAALLGPRDMVVYDCLAHNSIVLGASLSGAARRSFAHNDMAALDRLLASTRAHFDRVLVVVEGLYSMDGDVPDLAGLIDIKTRHDAWLMVDEAHALGVLGTGGAGSFEHCGIAPPDVDIWMGTLSKTLAGCGGYIAGCQALVDYLKCMAGAFVYSVGLSPPLAAAALACLEILHREPQRVARLQANSAQFWTRVRDHGFDVGSSCGSAIVPIMLGSSLQAVRLSQALLHAGINVQPIIPPAVPERQARLRFFLSAEHTAEQVAEAADMLVDCAMTVGWQPNAQTRPDPLSSCSALPTSLQP